MVADFRKSVEKVYGDNGFIGHNYLEIGNSIGYKFGTSSSNSEVSDYIYEQIRKTLSGTGLDKIRFEKMRKHCIVTAFLRSSDLNDKCFQVIEIIRDATRSIEQYTADWKSWQHAVLLVMAHNALGRYNPLDQKEIRYAKEKALADALGNIKRRGFTVGFISGEVVIKETEHRRIAKTIDSLLARLGINAFYHILNILKKHHLSDGGRYQFKRISHAKLVPWGYLFKLSLKHLEIRKDFKSAGKLWKEALEIAENYITLLELQEFSIFEYVGLMPQKVLPTIQKMVLNDQIYSIDQTNPDHISALLKGLFGTLGESEVSLPWKIVSYLTVVDAIIDIAKEGTPSLFSTSGIVRKVGNQLHETEVSSILESLSRSHEGINSAYLLPFDNKNKDYHFTPLIKSAEGSYMIYDLPFFSFGFFETLSSLLRVGGLTDDKVGTLLESYIEGLLRSSNVTYLASEKYNLNKSQQIELGTDRQSGECDFVIETPDTVIFIEVKKKILTRDAQSGNVLKIALDLVKSFLDAQKQGNWHELVLRKYGKITFVSGKEIELNNRQVEKVSLSMLDFSSLHDGFLLHKIMQNFVGAELKSEVTDVSIGKDIKYINSCLTVLGHQYKLPEFSCYSASNNPYFNCRFYNIFHFTEMMRDVTSAEEFKKAIWLTRHITTGEKDWFKEYVELSKVNRVNSISN